MLNDEVWKEVSEFPEYEVSDKGRLRKKAAQRLLKTYSLTAEENSYQVCSFNSPEYQHPQKRLLHRVVASAFIVNSENKRTVNHKDGKKKNNCKDNLEWATHGENIEHSIAAGLTVYNFPTRGLKLGSRSVESKSTAYLGVCWVASRNKWVTRVVFNNKVYGQKRFTDEIEAAKYRDNVVKEHNLPLKLNFN